VKIGDLIQYKHDGSRGMVIDIDFTHRNDAPILVLWSPEVSERYRLERTAWWVDLDSVEVTNEGR
tara:strand:+ start:277 stop:471 length:195 start_codon:yes stop_codon:yes gene_type:complete